MALQTSDQLTFFLFWKFPVSSNQWSGQTIVFFVINSVGTSVSIWSGGNQGSTLIRFKFASSSPAVPPDNKQYRYSGIVSLLPASLNNRITARTRSHVKLLSIDIFMILWNDGYLVNHFFVILKPKLYCWYFAQCKFVLLEVADMSSAAVQLSSSQSISISCHLFDQEAEMVLGIWQSLPSFQHWQGRVTVNKHKLHNYMYF